MLLHLYIKRNHF